MVPQAGAGRTRQDWEVPAPAAPRERSGGPERPGQSVRLPLHRVLLAVPVRLWEPLAGGYPRLGPPNWPAAGALPDGAESPMAPPALASLADGALRQPQAAGVVPAWAVGS